MCHCRSRPLEDNNFISQELISKKRNSAETPSHNNCGMDRPAHTPAWFEIDVDLGFALFFLFLLCLFLVFTVVRCAQTVIDPYGSIPTSTYQEEQITN
ncbi:hypothetical protein Baya_9520 [Bagarius yarrelli]|uniref:Cortexin-2 n=1 Tax=Bagarius yarrelli TaxID=175774 RepID=A0A556U8J8_BAGYA|nr:hypothetical protein Baya_9520 [Bagarius yarrelli]